MDNAPRLNVTNTSETIIPPIAFIDDVFRHSFWPAKEFFYDLLKVPFTKLGMRSIPPSVRRLMWKDGLLTPPFIPPGPLPNDGGWLEQYNGLSDESKQTLLRYVDRSRLYLCYEASPGLLTFLDEIGVTYIDIRVSPLRFMKDVAVAMRSNSREINAVMSLTSMSKADIESEALLLAASYRHFQRYLPGSNPQADGNDIYFVGQTATDASIIVGQSYFRIGDGLPLLAGELAGREVHYLPHPSASEAHIRDETAVLKGVSRSLLVEKRNSYDILCSDRPATLIGISSGLMQEAEFFGKRSISMLPPVCPLFLPEDATDFDMGYYQFTFDTFLNPDFWTAIFSRQPAGWRDNPRRMEPNELRELHNVWWAYPSHKTRPNDMTRAQSKEVQSHVDRLTGTTKFLMSVLFAAPKESDPILAQVTSRQWRWVDGATVSFNADGQIIKNNAQAGTWRVINGKAQAACAIWNSGGWMDFLEFDAVTNRLRGRNNTGDQFEVPPLN